VDHERPDVASKAVTLLGIEHLGCQQWVADPAKNSFTATGKPEFVLGILRRPGQPPESQNQQCK